MSKLYFGVFVCERKKERMSRSKVERESKLFYLDLEGKSNVLESKQIKECRFFLQPLLSMKCFFEINVP